MKTVTFFCIGILTTSLALGQIDGPRSPSTITNVSIGGSSASWGFLKNVKVSDGSFAATGDLPSIGNYSDYIVATDFSFNIPVGSTISGIVVEVERFDVNLTISDYSVRIVKGGTIGSTEKSQGEQYPSIESYTTYGGVKDKWGQTWSSVDINSSGFGVAIASQRTAPGITAGGIDHIQITVYYNFFTLPVEITSFTAAKNNSAKSTRLQWTCANEFNIDRYEVERSSDRRNFHLINSVAGRNQTNCNSYSSVDNNPPFGISYYRLKMVATSGGEKYSKIVKVEFKLNEYSLYPNLLAPGENLYITNSGNSTLEVSFYHLSGKLAATVSTNSRHVPLNQFSSLKGMFMYKVHTLAGAEAGQGKIIFQ